MNIRYAHTNIVARNWRSLAAFYQEVFGCSVVPPERRQSGEWLSRGTGVANASLEGVHLLLPGYSLPGPTLEIYQYADIEEAPPPRANRQGFAHIAFQTGDIAALLEKALSRGARAMGELSRHQVEGVGLLSFIYIADPEGNIIELQSWDH